jgi:predicted ester cyclase
MNKRHHVPIRLLLSACAAVFAIGCSKQVQPASAAPPAKNLEVARRFVQQGLTWKEPALFDQLVAEDVVVYTGLKPTGPIQGRKEYKGVFAAFAAAFTDIDLQVQDIFAEADGDRVVVRFRADATHSREFFGLAPTNRRIQMIETHVFRIEDGLIVESWVGANNFQFAYLMEPVMRAMILPDRG